MNRIKLLMVACLLGMAATASAQFANSKVLHHRVVT